MDDVMPEYTGPKDTDTETDDDLLSRARERFRWCMEAESHNRDLAKQQLEFAHGEQWPESVRTAREQDGRPCLTMNRIPALTRQVMGDIRQMRPALRIRAVDSASDPDTADLIMGMIRQIEVSSHAESAYDWAAQYAIDMGWGYWVYDIDYCDEKSFDLDIKVARVRNPFQIYIDHEARQQDGSDMRYAFEVSRMDKDSFNGKYPDAHSGWTEYAGIGADRDWWYDQDTVQIAKYWEIDEEDEEIVLLPNGEVVSMDELLAAMTAGVTPIFAVDQLPKRTSKRRRVTQYLITGRDKLEETPWPGRYIPIVRVVGNEVDIEGEAHYTGMTYDLIDPMRQYNYVRSSSVERIMLAPKAPFVGPRGSMKDPKWSQANTMNYPYLEYDGAVPPRREPPPDISPGLANEVVTAAEELRAISGIHEPGLGARSPEVSGIAINARKIESDVSNFHYIDNLGKAIRYGGQILVDLIPKVYSGERVVSILQPDNTTEQVTVGKTYVDQKTGRPRMHDLSVGRYDVAVDIGPSYTTQRQEAAEHMIELLKAFPNAAPIIGDLVAQNLDFHGADELAKRLKLVLPPEIAQNENPQIRALLAQSNQAVQQAQQVSQLLQGEIARLQNELQTRDRELALKVAELREKARQADQKHTEGMTKLELEAARDLNPAGVAY